MSAHVWPKFCFCTHNAPTGLLDKEEVAAFVLTAQSTLARGSADINDVLKIETPPFELERDWELMREGCAPTQVGVSFPMFEGESLALPMTHSLPPRAGAVQLNRAVLRTPEQ